MPAKKAQPAGEPCCKWCKKSLVSTPNPLVSNPGPKDFIKRRTPSSNECRPCFGFQQRSPGYSEMTRASLSDHLKDPKNFEKYIEGLESYCADRSDAVAGGATDATFAETSSSFSTKQIVGYFWPVDLLKRHSRPLPKKLSSLTHQGRVLKGVTLEEFAVGAIEVSTTSSRGAKRLAELAREDSDHEGEAASAFEKVQKKVRVSGTTSTAEDGESAEVTLKMPGKMEDDSEELHSILFGDVGKSRKEKGDSDDEQHASKRRATQRNRRTASGKGNGQEDSSTGFCGSNPDSAASGSAGSAWSISGANVTSKKAASESKDLDKAEALVLSVNQLKGQLGEETSVMQVSLKSVRSLVDKVATRLNPEGSKLFLEAVKRNGPSCRAASVWQSLKDSKACLETCL
eukprot:s1162_g10.t1